LKIKRLVILPALLIFSLNAISQHLPGKEKDKILLPNGWSLSPAGRNLPLGDLPLNITVSSSKKYIAITNNGQSTQSIQLIDPLNEKLLDEVVVAKCWVGLKFSTDEKYLYASGGNDNWILNYAIKDDKLILTDSIALGKKWPNKISPTGIDIDDAKQLLYVTTKDNSSLYVIDLATKKIKHQENLPCEAYTCLLSNDKKELYISCWGCSKLIIYNTVLNKITGPIRAGNHPNDLCQSKRGYLFVANSEDNSVSVIDIKNRKVTETLNAALYPSSPVGSTTNGVALSDDEHTLYIANADNNCISVFDVSKPGSSINKGFIQMLLKWIE
jgi:YVTN family beta-propeller protein